MSLRTFDTPCINQQKIRNTGNQHYGEKCLEESLMWLHNSGVSMILTPYYN